MVDEEGEKLTGYVAPNGRNVVGLYCAKSHKKRAPALKKGWM